MKPGDNVIYFRSNGFDRPTHRRATVTGLTSSPIDGERAFILVESPDELPSRDWVRQSSLQPYSDALWDALERWVEQQKALEQAHLQLRKGKIPNSLAMASLF